MSRYEDREEDQRDLEPGAGWQDERGPFDAFESDGEFDDSDRDTDFAPAYDEEEFDEEEPDYFDDSPEEEETVDTTDSAASARYDLEHEGHASGSVWGREPEDELAAADPDQTPETDENTWTTAAVPLPPLRSLPPTESLPEWADHEEPEYSPEDEEPQTTTFPLGLILVGLIALVLLGAGGYGVVTQRAGMQDEIRLLRAQLATSASPSEVTQMRASSEALKTRNTALESRLEALERENRTLRATVRGLEKQLEPQKEALGSEALGSETPGIETPGESAGVQPSAKAGPEAAAPAPAPKSVVQSSPPAPSPAATAAEQTANVTGVGWFVNFGSYTQQSTARDWANRLQPSVGDVVVTTGRKDGRTFHRVRVVNLASREEADSISRDLEQRFGLSKLWIGKLD